MTRRISVPIEIPTPTFEEMPDLLVEMADTLRKMTASSVALSKMATAAETDRVTELREKLATAEQQVAEYAEYCKEWEATYNELKASQPVDSAPMVTVWTKVYESATTLGRFHTKSPCPSGRSRSGMTEIVLPATTLEALKTVSGVLCPTCCAEVESAADWWPNVGETVKLAPNKERPQWMTGIVKATDPHHDRVEVQPRGHGYAVWEEKRYVRQIRSLARPAA